MLQSKKDEADDENANDETRGILHSQLLEEEPEKPTMTLRHIAKASALKLTMGKRLHDCLFFSEPDTSFAIP